MALSAARVTSPNKRRGATTTARPSTKYLNNGGDIGSASALRLQRLRTLGITGFRADLLAGMVWSDGGNDRLGGVQ